MKTKMLAGMMVLALIAVVVVMKLSLFPSIKDAYFSMDVRSLQQVPTGLVVVRPTHYPFLRRTGILYAPSPQDGGNGPRLMGRNLPLRDVIAAAYNQSPPRVLLPPGAPKGNFDFLVTVTGDPRQRLQAVIRRKLGYVAHVEMQDTDVLGLKVVDAHLPGLAVSGASEKENIAFNDVKLLFTHLQLTVCADGLEQFLKMPVVDKTGLTNFYNFSITWDPQTQRRLQDDRTARATADKILNDLGLGLRPDTASLEMLVVKKAD